MKRILPIILICALLVGCNPNNSTGIQASVETLMFQDNKEQVSQVIIGEEAFSFKSLADTALLNHLEESVYLSLVTELDSDSYFVENVSAIYVSKEYLEEIEYNSQENIYFGYKLSDIDEAFQGIRYVFTLGDNGQTVLKEFVKYDEVYNEVLKNVAIGTGVVLLCVTVSVVGAVVGAPAVSAIFAASAKSGAILAASSGVFSGVTAGVISGIKTKDFDTALEEAARAGSEGFKWGAIFGTISGGASKAISLKGATLNGLTMNEAAMIQKESRYPLDVIKQFQTMEQYEICKNAGLTPKIINGQTALIRKIDLNYADEFGITNLNRMEAGLAAIDPATGKSYQIHHIGQKADSTLAILTEVEHMRGGNNTIWHDLSKAAGVHGTGNNWDVQRQWFWKSMAKLQSTGG